MQRSAQRRSPATRRRRVIAVGTVVLVVGGMLAVTQISNASTRRWGFFGRSHHHQTACPTSRPTHRWDTRRDLATSRDGVIENHEGDGQSTDAGTLERAARERGRQRQRCTPSGSASAPATDPSSSSAPGDDGGTGDDNGSGRVALPPGGADGANNNLEVLGRDCTNSQLDIHDGFQNAPRCVETMMGEVPAADKGASLLITDHPDEVNVNEPFSFTVSTRNLQRDRFLGAAAGGYYLESSFLNEDGVVRGHFHNACQLLESTDVAPDPEPAPQFFVATEDGGGGVEPDSVTINVPGLPTPGVYRCSSWAGDGTHRVPMEQRANQTPAFDTFRLVVRE
jgi:hypothetical protein